MRVCDICGQPTGGNESAYLFPPDSEPQIDICESCWYEKFAPLIDRAK